jgi:hypothetical protein
MVYNSQDVEELDSTLDNPIYLVKLYECLSLIVVLLE